MCRWALGGLTVLSWIFSIVTVGACTFIKANYGDGNTAQSGIFSLDTANGCERYDGALGGGHRTSKAFGTFACLSTSACLILYPLIVSDILKNKVRDYAWLTTKILYAFTLFCVFLSFSIFGNCPDGADCKLGPAGGFTVFHVLLLIPMIAAAWIIPLPPTPLTWPSCGGSNVFSRPSPPPPATTKTIETTPDGDRKITEIVTDEKGHRTTTVTIQKRTFEDDEEGP